MLSTLSLDSPRRNSAGFQTRILSWVIPIAPRSALVIKHCSLDVPLTCLILLDCAWLSCSIYSFAGYEKFEIFNFMFSGIMSTDLLITRQLISDSWLVTDITSHVREPRGMASGAKCHTEQSATPQGHLLVSVGATSRYPHRVPFVPITQIAYVVGLSATRIKIPHHTRGGGHLLVSMEATSRYSLPHPWFSSPSDPTPDT